MKKSLVIGTAFFVASMMVARALAVEIADPINPKPAYVLDLERSFGGPSESGFGSAVFTSSSSSSQELEARAFEVYRHFVGPLWDRWGETAWKGNWRLAYRRAGVGNIIAELGSLTDPDATSTARLMLEGTEDPTAAKAAVVLAFDDSAIVDLMIFNLGDGAAISGLLIGARRQNGETTFLVTLMD
ncbi:hypothetical protein [Mesorhizobium marinum]|uniref:hypothetical protein n=1 Tax=Mesorhizobium marinum TaxID=3228790 RepID=UPI0034659350